MGELRRYSGAVYDKDELLSMISAMLDGWWSGGNYTLEFEKRFADFLGVKHAVSCNSGSSANLLAVSALELEKGGEVITPATTFPTTLNPIIQCGLIPVFIDVELGSYNINPSLMEAAMNVGANRWQCFFKVVFPLTIPGMYAGSLVVFALNYCAFAVPLMVGSQRTNMIGLVIYNQSMQLNNMPFAAAMSVILMVTSILILTVYGKVINRYFFRRLGL